MAPAFLPTALSVALRPLFPFQQAQFVPVFPLKPAPFCTLFAGLGNTIKSAIFLLFSSCLTRSVLATLSSPPPFLLSQTLWQIWQELSSLSSCVISNSVVDLAGTVFSLLLFYQATMGPRTLVSPGERHS